MRAWVKRGKAAALALSLATLMQTTIVCDIPPVDVIVRGDDWDDDDWDRDWDCCDGGGFWFDFWWW